MVLVGIDWVSPRNVGEMLVTSLKLCLVHGKFEEYEGKNVEKKSRRKVKENNG